MKTVYFVLLCCLCLISCHYQTKSNMEKFDLKISLFFYPSMANEDIKYSIDIVKDTLIVKNYYSSVHLIRSADGKGGGILTDSKEYYGNLTELQCIEIKKLVSTLSQKYDRSKNFVKGGSGCTLTVDNQVYYEDNFFSFVPESKETSWLPPPEEIKSLIDYIVSLSPIPIELNSFS